MKKITLERFCGSSVPTGTCLGVILHYCKHFVYLVGTSSESSKGECAQLSLTYLHHPPVSCGSTLWEDHVMLLCIKGYL